MEDKRSLGMGNVTVRLVDDSGIEHERVLKPSLHAIRSLSRSHGGLQPVIEKVLKLDFDVMVDVVALGMQIPMTNPKSRMELEQSVYRSGVTDPNGGLALALVQYLNNLAHGGKPPPADGAEGAPQANPPNAS